jgi:hypothetical protein
VGKLFGHLGWEGRLAQPVTPSHCSCRSPAPGRAVHMAGQGCAVREKFECMCLWVPGAEPSSRACEPLPPGLAALPSRPRTCSAALAVQHSCRFCRSGQSSFLPFASTWPDNAHSRQELHGSRDGRKQGSYIRRPHPTQKQESNHLYPHELQNQCEQFPGAWQTMSCKKVATRR